METGKRKELLRDGWVFGDAAAFLELSPEEAEIIELNLASEAGLQDRQPNFQSPQRRRGERPDGGG